MTVSVRKEALFCVLFGDSPQVQVGYHDSRYTGYYIQIIGYLDTLEARGPGCSVVTLVFGIVGIYPKPSFLCRLL